MSGPAGKRVISLLAVIVGLAVAAGIAAYRGPVRLPAGTQAQTVRTLPVRAVVRACPAPGLSGGPTARLAMVAMPDGGGTGVAQVSRIGAALRADTAQTAQVSQVESITQPAALTVTAVQRPKAAPHRTTGSVVPSGETVPTVTAQGGVAIAASGSMARGLEAEQVTSASGVSTPCDSPGTQFWFTGPGRGTTGHDTLVLMNVDAQAADVSVTADTDAGPVPMNDSGIQVAPHTTITQSLDTLLHGARDLTLAVHASSGQVVAALAETPGSGSGSAWLPAQQQPADRLVIPALPGTAGTPQVFVGVPGTQDAKITVTAVTTKGSYVPTNGSGLDIPGNSATSFALPSLSGAAGALEVTASVPVTAMVMLPAGSSSPGLFSAAVPALDEQGVVAEDISGGGTQCEVVLAAPGRAATARVSVVGEATGHAGGPAPQGPVATVAVPAHHAVVVPVRRPPGTAKAAQFAVVVSPVAGSGPLYAERVLLGSGKGGPLRSVMPIPSALTSVSLPAVDNVLLTAGH